MALGRVILAVVTFSPHPYLFFNNDGHGSLTFLGFHIDPSTGDAVDFLTGKVMAEKIMLPNLQESLLRNRVPLRENFEDLTRYANYILPLSGYLKKMFENYIFHEQS